MGRPASILTELDADGTAGTVLGGQVAHEYAVEAGINAAESTLYYQKQPSSGNPSAAYLFGCAGATGAERSSLGPSNCSSPQATVFCVAATSPCTAGTAGTATSSIGYFSGTNAGSC